MSQEETMHRFIKRSKILGDAVSDAWNDISSIERLAQDLIARDPWNREKDLIMVQDILQLATRQKGYLSEVNK